MTAYRCLVINYLAKFIPRPSDVNEPLSNYLGKVLTFKWSKEQNEYFKNLRKLISKAPVLKYCDVSEPVTLTVESSGIAAGGCIFQNKNPVVYTA